MLGYLDHNLPDIQSTVQLSGSLRTKQRLAWAPWEQHTWLLQLQSGN